MLRARRALAAAAAFSAAAALPSPPQRSAWQQRVFDRAAAAADAASRAATPALLAFLDDAGFRALITECCPDIAQLPAEAIAQRFRDEVAVSELVHNFNAAPPSPQPQPGHHHHGGLNLDVAMPAEYLYNDAQLWYLNLTSSQRNLSHSDVEQNIFGCMPWSSPNGPATFEEASNCIMYVAQNLNKIDLGNPTFGSVSMIFSNSYARNMTLIAPVDTGMWQHICYENNSAPWFSKNFTCSAWPKPYTLGTLQAFDHVILANAIMWQDQLGQGSAKIALAKVFSRMFGQWGKYPVNSSNILTYWESDFQGAVLYPQGVRMVVGSFSELFGTHYGKLLRDWCAARGWILAWAMGGVPNTTSLAGHRPPHRLSADDWPSVPYAYNNRLLDPAVFARTNAARNASIPGNASAAFSAVWDAVNASVAQQGASGRQWHEWWAALRAGAPAALSVAPLSARSCADPDRCVGVDAARRCVCYQS